MSEIYWITRLDGIHGFLLAILIVLVSIEVIVFFRSALEYEPEYDFLIKVSKIFIPMILIFLLLKVFIPSTKDALIIFEVGGTIDYLQSNEKVKEFPDKTIDAIDIFIDEYINKKKEK